MLALESVEFLPFLLASAVIARRAPTRAATDCLEDGELVRRAQSGDSSAEEAIYRRHLSFVGGIAARLLRNRAETEDIVQETFIAVLEHIDSVRDGEALRAYLAQSVVRASRRRLRRRRILSFLSLDDPQGEVGLETMAQGDASSEARAELALLDRALGRLSTELRIAWTLRRVEGLELDEVAAACGCSLATAKRRIAAADAEVRRHVSLTTSSGEDAS